MARSALLARASTDSKVFTAQATIKYAHLAHEEPELFA
jgi:hypothetical protein